MTSTDNNWMNNELARIAATHNNKGGASFGGLAVDIAVTHARSLIHESSVEEHPEYNRFAPLRDDPQNEMMYHQDQQQQDDDQ